MAYIDPYVQAIRSAVYGEEVRDSIANAIVAMNNESSSAKSTAQQAQDSASAKAIEAASSALAASESAATAETVAQSLGFRSKSVTLLNSSWTLSNDIYTQTVTVSGVLTTDFVLTTLGNVSAEHRGDVRGASISCVAQAENSLTFEAEKLPGVNVPINILLVGGAR